MNLVFQARVTLVAALWVSPCLAASVPATAAARAVDEAADHAPAHVVRPLPGVAIALPSGPRANPLPPQQAPLAPRRLYGVDTSDRDRDRPVPLSPVPLGQTVALAALVAAMILGIAWARRRPGLPRRHGRGDGRPATDDQPVVEPPTRLASLWLLVTVVLVGQVAHHLYPFYAFDMYSYSPASGSRLVAVDRAGVVHEVTAFQGWRCDRLPKHITVPAHDVCGPFEQVDVADRELLAWVREHQADGAGRSPEGAGSGSQADASARTEPSIPMLLARRIRRFDAEGEHSVTLCPITACEVRP